MLLLLDERKARQDGMRRRRGAKLMPLLIFAAFISGISGFIPLTQAYDINCIWPENMPDPLTARYQITLATVIYTIRLQLETPVTIHQTGLYGTCAANCLAYHDDKMLNVITKQRPLLSVPPFGHNSFSRLLCTLQCYSLFISDFGPPDPIFKPFFDEWGAEVTALDPTIAAAAASMDALQLLGIVQDADYHPFIIGQLVALELVATTVGNADGWNVDGSFTYDPETDSAVPCTANCMPYSDTTGYIPRNHPRKPSSNEDKYAVNGTDKFWQPLLEDDGKGYFSRQEHVVPHIGLTAKPLLPRPLGELSDPQYNYTEEALLVIERLRETASSQERKAKIKFYDNKLLVRGAIQRYMVQNFKESQSYEDQILYIYGLDLAEHDALLSAWKEKVRHDLVRPTTVIQRWGSDLIDTYNGDPLSSTSSVIAARDFQAFIRVMPHSEYPSGSGCLCAAYAEMTAAFTESYHNGSRLEGLKFGPDGFNLGCDGSHGSAFGCTDEEAVEIPDMSALRNDCGASRLWGGMHFTSSVADSYELCEGLGNLAFETMEEIRNGSNFTNTYRSGDPLPRRDAPGSNCPPEPTNSDAEVTENATSNVSSQAWSGGSAHVEIGLFYVGFLLFQLELLMIFM